MSIIIILSTLLYIISWYKLYKCDFYTVNMPVFWYRIFAIGSIVGAMSIHFILVPYLTQFI